MRFTTITALSTVFVSMAVTALSSSQAITDLALPLTLSLTIFHASLASAYALPNNLKRHDGHGGDDTGDDSSAAATSTDNATNNAAGAGRQRSKHRGGKNKNGGGEDTGNDDNSSNGADAASSGATASNSTTGTSTSSGNASLSTGTAGSAVGVNGTSSIGSDDGSGSDSGASTGTLPEGFPPASPEDDFVAGEDSNSGTGLSKAARMRKARRDVRETRDRVKRKAMKVPVAPKRDLARAVYDK